MGRRKREQAALELLTRLDERQKAAAHVLALQAIEYERRLEQLNHEASRINAAANASVSRELFDAKMEEIHRWEGTVARQMATWTGAGAAVIYILYWITHR